MLSFSRRAHNSATDRLWSRHTGTQHTYYKHASQLTGTGCTLVPCAHVAKCLVHCTVCFHTASPVVNPGYLGLSLHLCVCAFCVFSCGSCACRCSSSFAFTLTPKPSCTHSPTSTSQTSTMSSIRIPISVEEVRHINLILYCTRC